jgi:hypothetical protein
MKLDAGRLPLCAFLGMPADERRGAPYVQLIC